MILYLSSWICPHRNSQENLFLEYSTKRRDLQSVDILMRDNEVGHLDKALATTLFLPLTYSIS